MNLELKALLPALHAEVARYLTTFPSERGHLSGLTEQLPQDGENILLRSNMRAHITTSSLVLNPQSTKALLIRHRLYDRWLQPGGHYELPGGMWESAQREVEEETGVVATLHPWSLTNDVPLDIDTHSIPAQARKNEGPHTHHDFVYLSVAEESTLSPQLEEVHAAAWMPLEELRALNTIRMNRMLDKVELLTGRRIEAAATC